jgi:hypothetical protein
MSFWRPQFEDALKKLAQVSSMFDERGFRPPVLVGGGAVELYTQSAVNTGDFDLVTTQQAEFESVLVENGFFRPSGPGQALRGWIHLELQLGFEVVGSRLLDGLASSDRIRIVEVGRDGAIAVIAVEDLIADRMGQYASGSADELYGQAEALFRLSKALDLQYMERRIREETDRRYGVQDLQDQA